jgi:hypothetical protein
MSVAISISPEPRRRDEPTLTNGPSSAANGGERLWQAAQRSSPPTTVSESPDRPSAQDPPKAHTQKIAAKRIWQPANHVAARRQRVVRIFVCEDTTSHDIGSFHQLAVFSRVHQPPHPIPDRLCFLLPSLLTTLMSSLCRPAEHSLDHGIQRRTSSWHARLTTRSTQMANLRRTLSTTMPDRRE